MEDINYKITSLEFQIKRYESILETFNIKDDSPQKNKNYAKMIKDKMDNCKTELAKIETP